MLSGHLSLAALLHRYTGARPVPVVVGSLFPDLVDKTAYHGLGLSRSGRFLAHSLPGMAVSVLAVFGLFGRQSALDFGLGYFGHLLADAGGFVPWFYPFKSYRFPRSFPLRYKLARGQLTRPSSLEIILFFWAALASVKRN